MTSEKFFHFVSLFPLTRKVVANSAFYEIKFSVSIWIRVYYYNYYFKVQSRANYSFPFFGILYMFFSFWFLNFHEFKVYLGIVFSVIYISESLPYIFFFKLILHSM